MVRRRVSGKLFLLWLLMVGCECQNSGKDSGAERLPSTKPGKILVDNFEHYKVSTEVEGKLAIGPDRELCIGSNGQYAAVPLNYLFVNDSKSSVSCKAQAGQYYIDENLILTVDLKLSNRFDNTDGPVTVAQAGSLRFGQPSVEVGELAIEIKENKRYTVFVSSLCTAKYEEVCHLSVDEQGLHIALKEGRAAARARH